MADQVKIVVVLDTKDAKKKLKDFDKGVKDAKKDLEKKPKTTTVSKSRARQSSSGGSGAAGKAGAAAALIGVAIALINKVLVGMTSIAETQKGSDSAKKVGELGQSVLDLKTKFLSNVTGFLGAQKAAKKFERVGLGLDAEQFKALQKEFTTQAKIEIQLNQRNETLDQSDYLKAIKRFAGNGGS